MKKLYIFLFALILGISVKAQTFSAVNSDGDTIYYGITNSYAPYKVEVKSNPNKYSGDITIPDSVLFNNIYYKVTTISANAFSACNTMTSMTLPSSITRINEYAFSSCTALHTINIPESVTYVGYSVFIFCFSLNTVYFNATNCLSMGGGATYYVFSDCNNLRRVIIGNNVTRIPAFGFYNCSALTSINIPSSVNNIGISAFHNCTNLDTIIMNRINPPTISNSSFQNVPYNTPIILPCSSLLNYKNANYWSSFTNFQELGTCLYDINVQSIDSTLGTVTGGGIYTFDTITITSTPFQGNYFTRWQDGDTNSIRTVIVTKDSNFTAIFKQVVYSNINDTICQGQTYLFFGNNLTTEGLYSHTIAVSQTKDSIIKLQLKVNPTYSIIIYDSICEGQTYTQNGFNTDTAGIFTQSLQTTKGCDSIINLHLLVNPNKTTNLQASICQGHTYSLNGFNADTAGTHTLNLQTYKGCDSTVNLSLIVNPTYTIDIQGEVCEGRFYYQNGFFVHMPGTYTRVLQTKKGCDSIVNLHLTVNPTFSDTIFAQICQGEVYTENGFNANTTGLYTQNLQTIKGCDSIIYLSLIVNEILTPTNLTLNNIANYIELNWEGEEENYIIYRNNDSLAMTTSRIYKDSNIVEGANYCYKIKALNENCESDFSNEECKTFLGINTITTNDFNAMLYPNPTKDKTTLRVEGLNENADIIVYDIYGRKIKTYKLNANQNELEIDVKEFSKGVYNIKLTNSNYNITKKLIVK